MKAGRKTIDALLSHNGCRIEVSTGIVVPKGIEFIPPRVLIGGNSNTRAKLEKDIHEWEETIRNKYIQLVSLHGMVFSADIFRAGMKLTVAATRGDLVIDVRTTLFSFFNQFGERVDAGLASKKSTGTPYAKKSKDNLKRVVKIINSFIAKYGDFDFGKYNLDTEKTIGKPIVISVYDDLCQRIKDYMISERKFGSISVLNNVNKVKFIIGEMCEIHGINICNRYLAKLKYSRPNNSYIVAMSQEQFEWVISNEDKIRRENSYLGANGYIDFLIAALMTAARVGDLNKFTVDNLIKTDDGYILHYIPEKTKNSSGAKVEIPISERLAKMFLTNAENYNGKLLRLNIKSIQLISEKIRQILRKYEIFQNPIHVQDRYGNISVMPFWKAFKFHSTRASLITYLLSKGEQETVIKSISGHALDSSSFKSYTNITKAMRQRTMQRLALIGSD